MDCVSGTFPLVYVLSIFFQHHYRPVAHNAMKLTTLLPDMILTQKRLCLSLLFSLLLFGAGTTQADDSQLNRDTYKHLEIFSNVLVLLQQHYVDEVDTEKIINGAINGMLNSLDPHSSYMSPEDFSELQEETQGSFHGIGIEITVRDNILTVVAPIEGTPAEKKGLQAGDQIIRINGILTKNMSLMDAVKSLRGELNTEVTLTIYREKWKEMREITLLRDIIPLYSVKSLMLEPGILYTRITSFQATTTRDFRKALLAGAKEHPIKGLVLDLRNNPGGLLDQAVKIADIFLDDGIIVSTKGRNGREQMVFEAHNGGPKNDFPMVVLVNGGSASGSEIVAGALQDNKRAIILGTTTFGKGSVQTVLPMPGGAGIRLTTARYYTPSGTSIQATGIHPDIEAPLSAEPDKKNEDLSAPQVREKDLPGHFINTTQKKSQAETETVDTKNDNKQKQQEITEKLEKDSQLRTALIILKSLEIVAEK